MSVLVPVCHCHRFCIFPPTCRGPHTQEEEGAHVEREFQVVEKIASFLGMKCVGFMFSQRDVRDPGSPFSAAEVYRMATLQKRFGEKFVSVCCPGALLLVCHLCSCVCLSVGTQPPPYIYFLLLPSVLEVNGRFAMRCEAWQVSDQCVQVHLPTFSWLLPSLFFGNC